MCVGAPCMTKDEMDQLPVVVVVVVVSLKSQHPSQKLSSSEHAPVQDRYMYLTIPTVLSFSGDTWCEKTMVSQKPQNSLSLSIGELHDFFSCILRIKVHVGRGTLLLHTQATKDARPHSVIPHSTCSNSRGVRRCSAGHRHMTA